MIRKLMVYIYIVLGEQPSGLEASSKRPKKKKVEFRGTIEAKAKRYMAANLLSLKMNGRTIKLMDIQRLRAEVNPHVDHVSGKCKLCIFLITWGRAHWSDRVNR